MNSPKQLKALFYDVLKYPTQYHMKTVDGQKQRSITTDVNALEELEAAGYPIAATLAKFRKMGKLKGTYIDGIFSRLSAMNRLHTDFMQASTLTGRLCVPEHTPVEVLRDVAAQLSGVPVERVKPGDWAYTYDRDCRLTLRRVVGVWKTGHKRVMRVHWLGDGRTSIGHVDLTPDHRVRLVRGEYVRVQHLQPGDRVLSLSRGVTNYGYARLWATGHDEIQREHRFVAAHFGIDGEHVHHKDGNKLNNRPANLQGLPAPVHVSFESRHAWTPARRDRQRQRSRRAYASNRTHLVRRGPLNARWLGLSKEWLLQVLWQNQGRPTAFRDLHGIDYGTVMKYLRRFGINWRAIRKEFNAHDERLTKDVVDRARRVHEQRGTKAALSDVGVNYYKFKKLQEQNGYVPYNHRVISVELLPDATDVYDVEVEETHNFIAGGICVHNSASHPPA